jgi:CPA2 family monovalent cation:H+ antiporter-2
MTAESTFFRDIALVFVAALAGGWLAQAARQPLFVGYIIGGLLISPFTPGPAIRDVATFELFAQIGVVLLMFSIGIEFSLHEMTRIGSPTFVGAPVVMILVVAITVLSGKGLGWKPTEGAAVGIVISVASTMVVAKLLLERGEINSPHARLAVGTLLMEDLLVVVLIVLLPVLAGSESGRASSVGIALGRAALVLVPFFYLANRVVPRALARVARRRDPEMFVLVAMAIGIGTAALSSSLGLSLALGAFLAGLIISESEFTHEVLARLLPMRDVFGALFFVSLGTLVRPGDLVSNLPLLLGLLGLIVIGKFGVRAVVLRLFRYPWPTAALVSIHLAQTGEFSFVLAQVARDAGLFGDTVYRGLIAASLLSILITAVLSDLAHRWIEEPAPPEAPRRETAEPNRVLICGFGRVGGTIGEALEAFHIPYTVVDLDFPTIEALRKRGIPTIFGDAAGEPVLRSAAADRARLAVVTIPDFERTRLAVRRIRELNADVPILARSSHLDQRMALIEAGATEVIQPEFEAAQTLIRHSLEGLGITHDDVKNYMQRQRQVEYLGSVFALAPPDLHLLKTKTVVIHAGLFDDVSLRRARIRERAGVWVLSLRRHDSAEILDPVADTVLRAGDEVTVLGLPEQIELFESLNREPAREPFRTEEPFG